MTQQRICILNDISCEGRCSITAALPIYAAAGIHGNAIPTALLSTQTGGYTGYTYLDLSGEIMNIAKHFCQLGLEFDVLYTGYLASKEQVDLVLEVVNMLPAKTLIVDPVMGDSGKLYDGFTIDYCDTMKKLCSRADIIVPNLTEACFLTGYNYDFVTDENHIYEIVSELHKICPKKLVITGVKKKTDGCTNQVGVAVFDGVSLNFRFSDEIDGVYHGAGDVFGAVLSCGLAHGEAILDAAMFAHSFTHTSIRITNEDGTDTRQGLNFEKCLGLVFERYNKK